MRASEAMTRQQEANKGASQVLDSQQKTEAKADAGQQTEADNKSEAPGSSQTIDAVSMRKITAASRRWPTGHKQEPLEPAQQGQLPVHIVVEPRNDESIQCYCRNCQFLSGWYCMPCAILIFIVLLIFWASTKLPRPHEAPTQAIRSTTTPSPFNRTTPARVNATAQTGNLLLGSDLGDYVDSQAVTVTSTLSGLVSGSTMMPRVRPAN